MEVAFAPGYDPALELTRHTKIGRGVDDLKEGVSPEVGNLRQKEQAVLDSIMQGKEPGHYFLLTGPKVRPTPRLHARKQPHFDTVSVGYWEGVYDSGRHADHRRGRGFVCGMSSRPGSVPATCWQGTQL